MVGHISSPYHASSLFLSPQHCFLLFLSDVDLASIGLPCFLLSSERQMRNKREKKPRGSCPHIITTPFIPPPSSLPLVLYPPSFCLPEWQLAASRVQWACQPKCRYLPTDLRKYTFERAWLMRAAALDLLLLLFFVDGLNTCSTHYTPCCPQSFVAIKTGNSTFTKGL